MTADMIMSLNESLLVAAPLLLLLAGIAALMACMACQRLPFFLVVIASAVGLGWLGAFGLEAPQRSSWGFEVLALPFLFCKWALLGLTGSVALVLFLCPRRNGNRIWSFVFAALCLAGLGVTGAAHTYVAAIYKRDQAFWKWVFVHDAADLPFDSYRSHLSRAGREALDGYLQYNKQVPSALLKTLTNVSPRGAVIAADQAEIDPVLIAAILQSSREARLHDVPSSPAGDSGLPLLARNPRVPFSLLATLSSDPSAEVRQSVALNSATPVPILIGLIADTERRIAHRQDGHRQELDAWNAEEIKNFAQRSLARRSDAMADVLRALADETDEQLRSAVASNVAAPQDLLMQLAKDPSARVRETALGTLARSPNTGKPLLRELYARGGNEARAIRQGLATNPRVPLDLLERLFVKGDYETRMVAVRNLATGDESSRTFLKDQLACIDSSEARAVADEKNLPKWVYVVLIQRSDSQTAIQAWERLSNCQEATKVDLEKLLASASPETKSRLAGSVRCSKPLLELLTKDPSVSKTAWVTLAQVNENGVYDR